jgi:hypothetical protein
VLVPDLHLGHPCLKLAGLGNGDLAQRQRIRHGPLHESRREPIATRKWQVSAVSPQELNRG